MSDINNPTSGSAGQDTPAPTPPANPLQPRQNSSYTTALRSKIQEWMNAPDDGSDTDEGAGVEEMSAAAPEAQAEPEAVVTETPIAESGAAEGVSAQVVEEAPTQEGAAPPAEPEVEPAKPKPYAVKMGNQDYPVPEDLTFTYKADGAERTRTLDEVIRYAQLGENYDRRSRELAQSQRDLEVEFDTRFRTLNEQYQQAWNDVMELTRRLAEDDDFREEYLEEYHRLKANPEELQIRLRAQKAEQYEQMLNELQRRQHEEWERQVWNTVDQIIGEQLADYDPDTREPLARRIRDRFHFEFSRRGSAALKESLLLDLIDEERGFIDRAVEAARRQVESQLGPQVRQARAQAVVETKNNLAERALQREREALAAPRPGPVPTPQRVAPKIEKLADAKKALEKWAAS